MAIEDEPGADARRQAAAAAQPLEQMSIEELEARVATLRAEIAKCEALIAAKRSHRSAADALFGRAE